MADLRVFGTKAEQEQATGALDRLLSGSEAELERELDAAVAELQTPEDVARWQQAVRRDLAGLLGEFPDRSPLRPCVVGKIERRDLVVEKVLLESRPRYYVTANLYIPRHKPLPAPGVLVACGHSATGKASSGNHRSGMGLALKGYVALVYDPTGQGERSECYNPKTRRHIVHREVPQHHYTGKPLFLSGLTLAGWRTWDGIRCIDYLVGRDEVDASRLGVMGCSGGGAMTMLISCVDERVTACAPSHPGGSMENTHLRGRRPPDRRLYSLLAPRPCRVIVGDASGEEPGHRRKVELMRPFYEACGCPERLEFVLVDGGHDLRLPKRAASYEWLGRWLGPDDPGPDEPPFRRVSRKRLFCTETGQVLGSLSRARTMQQIHAARVRKLAPTRRVAKTPGALATQLNALRRRVEQRVGFQRTDGEPDVRTPGVTRADGAAVERLTFESEPGLPVPAVLF
ncbi:MAG: alpha/beta hydrolase, partial [Planctomycetota bacterium]